MKDYKFDYGNDSFRIDRGLDGDRYFIKVNNDYIEVNEEVFKICRSSYDKIRYTYKQEVARSIIYYEDIDSATFFVNSASYHKEDQFIKELAQRAKEEINLLSGKDRLIAICLFIKQMTLQETAEYLGVSITAVFKRKKKIQKNLQNILRNG
ncbi:MAG: sigma-70 family RNA polymerase sigma factor [Erysipelotrichaceae bacterium]|nr:sigma-70 family RNA polymerase sigma factor [Erysipelotrichaceae bacterium]